MPFTILPFDSTYQSEVIDLIERIQIGEFKIPIEEAQRRELQSISQSFQKNKGNYWVALFNGKVIGTIAVIDIGHSAFELRDVFLDQEYRGQKTGFAKKLLDTVLSWSNKHNVKTIFLGTTLSFKAAHRFYEKHGFSEIERQDMPSYCQPMDCDEKFYRLDLMKKYTIVEKPSITVVGIECRTSNSPDAGPQDIPKHWGKFYSECILDKIPNKTSNEIIALYCDYEDDHTKPYSLVIGCSVNSVNVVPNGMVAKTIPAGSYAVFKAIGEHPQALIETWGQIWQQTDLQRSYTGDYEAYNQKFFTQTPQEIEVYIAIQKSPQT